MRTAYVHLMSKRYLIPAPPADLVETEIAVAVPISLMRRLIPCEIGNNAVWGSSMSGSIMASRHKHPLAQYVTGHSFPADPNDKRTAFTIPGYGWHVLAPSN